jgi:FG-GAP-like repeat
MRNTLKLAVLLALSFVAIAATPTMPTFFARRDYLIGSQFIQVADVNGDGIPDLLAYYTGTIIVQFGNGDGTFRQGPSTNTGAGGAGAQGFVPIDLNNDGKIDLVLTDGTGIMVAMGNGDGTFQPSVYYPINDHYIGALVLGDFDGDGILDVAAAGNTAGVWLLTGTGGGTFNSAVLAVSVPGCFNIAAADFNGDGKLDLVVTQLTGSRGNGFTVLFGNGNGTFQPPQRFSTPNTPTIIAVGRLVKDGPPSIVVNGGHSGGDVFLYFGNGAGGFTGPKVLSLPGSQAVDGVALGDVNGDGWPDLVSVGGFVAYGEGGGNFSAPMSFPVDAANTADIVLADLRNNGLTDIIASGSYSFSVLLNDGNKGFEDGIWTSVTGGAGCGVKGDFNGDGKLDLAVNNSNGIAILLGTGKGATPFTPGTNITLAGADCLVTTDLNGDGKLDLLVPAQGGVYAYLGNGDGTFTLASITPTPSGGYLAPGDFNHDGKVDFATSGNLIALGNGDGTFQSPTDIVASPPSGGYSGIAAGDINNDGWKDLVLTSNVFPVDAPITVLLNNHKGGFNQVATSFGALSYNPILADVNGDGNLDLVLSYTGGLATNPPLGASIYLGKGAGGDGKFTYSQTLREGAQNPTLNFVGDLNGDGIPDICVLEADTLEIYLGGGNATYATPFAIGTGPSPGSILVEHLHELSTPGLPDIVVPDTSGGVMVLLNLTP